MKVAIDKGPLTSGHAVRGVGAYTRELIGALEQETRLRKATARQGLKIEAVDFEKADLSKYDLLHYPYFNPFFLTLPLRKPTKIVVTIHDLIPLIYPKHYPPGLKGKLRFYLQRFLLKNVDGIITVSETSKKDIVRFLGVPQEKIKVIYEAPRKIFRKLWVENRPAGRDSALREELEIKKRYGLPERFVLYVGDVNYNKNILNLVKASKIAKLPLVIVGKQALDIEDQGLGLHSVEGPKDWIRFLFNIPHPELAHFGDLIDACRGSKRVIRTGFVPDADLVYIYNLASVYCQPSFYEGFGLPVLEAMACGIPTVVAKTQALVEIGDGSAMLADPNDAVDIADKIKLVSKDSKLRKQYEKKSENRVKNFSWAKVASETSQFYAQILTK